jgi:hypothetical protein
LQGFLDNSPSSVENLSINNTRQIPYEMYDSRGEERDGSEFDTPMVFVIVQSLKRAVTISMFRHGSSVVMNVWETGGR